MVEILLSVKKILKTQQDRNQSLGWSVIILPASHRVAGSSGGRTEGIFSCSGGITEGIFSCHGHLSLFSRPSLPKKVPDFALKWTWYFWFYFAFCSASISKLISGKSEGMLTPWIFWFFSCRILFYFLTSLKDIEYILHVQLMWPNKFKCSLHWSQILPGAVSTQVLRTAALWAGADQPQTGREPGWREEG